MARAGVLDVSGVAVGVTAEEIVGLALANVGTAWTGIPASFAWAISNLAGLPFFDLEDLTDGPANTFVDTGYDSPHRRNENTPGDGWDTVWADSSNAYVTQLVGVLRPGDIVRVYDNSNPNEGNGPDRDGPNSHSFIVVSTSAGQVEVVDVWNGRAVGRHSFQDIVDEMAENGKFQSAYVSRINNDFIEDHVPATLRGNGYGDWSGIGSDLLVSAAPSASAVWDNGSLKLNLSYTVTNGGIMRAGATQTGIYLSTDSEFDAKDEFLTWDAVAALNSGISSTEGVQFTRAAGDLASGTYYLFAVADGDKKVAETNEINNVSPAAAFFVPPQSISDLDITSTPVLQIVWAAAGGSYNLTYSITNRGTTGTTPATHTGIYLSTDSTITTADRLVNVDNVADLLAGASSSEGGTFVLPGNVAAGNYYIGVVADHDNAVAETDETNNVSTAVRITVVTEGADRIVATTAEKSWHGLGGNDTIAGTTGRDALYGDDGGDSLLGGGGNDTLIGGNGADALSGGAGADYFQFNGAAEIGTRAGSRDRIIDWNPADDYIDLRPIDAKTGTTANDAFTFVAAQGSTFSGAKGQLRWVTENYAGTSNDRTLVMGDVDGDRRADFVIEISGLHTMRAVDFLL